jgi:UDP-GlcNAc:undecaprenyl-phosphate GlcNAc-1-phosphate transferase
VWGKGDRTVFVPSLLALAVALLATPCLRRLALRVGAVDRPGQRTIHDRAVPFLGGLAIYLAFAAGLVLARGWSDHEVWGVLGGGALVLGTGLVDDAGAMWSRRLPWLADREGRGLRPLFKLLAQVAAALVLYLYGVRITFIQVPFAAPFAPGGLWFLPGPGILAFTVIWVVAITNALNFIDGLDGLAAGVSAISAATLLVVSLESPGAVSTDAALICAVLLASTLGFLPWNFHPARIFMGDAGALFLGYALAAVAILGPLKTATVVSLAVPALALGVPVLDTCLAIVRRWRARQLPGVADRGHLHHRLLELGLTHRDAVLVLYVASAWLGLAAITVARAGPALGLGVLALVFASVVVAARALHLTGPRRSPAARVSSRGPFDA